jgi:ParB family chromosome partitioning protein
VCYEERPRLSGGAYQPILRRVDEFLDRPMPRALKEREQRGRKILKLDDAVSAAVEKLKARGLTSPYRLVDSRLGFSGPWVMPRNVGRTWKPISGFNISRKTRNRARRYRRGKSSRFGLF